MNLFHRFMLFLRTVAFFEKKIGKNGKNVNLSKKISSGKFFHIYELNPFLDHFASNFVNLT